MSKKILIIGKSQFGYLVDYYYWCKYLSAYYSITYIGFLTNIHKVAIENVKILHFTHHTSKLRNIFDYFRGIIYELSKTKYELIIVNYFHLCFLLPLIFRKKKFILDIRTGFLTDNKYIRNFQNNMIKLSSLFFCYTTIISESLAHKLRLKSFIVVPLGANKISNTHKNYNKLHLLYVGTLQKRRIHETIEGFVKFKEKYPNVDIIYSIIGEGKEEDEKKINNCISAHEIENQVIYYGGIPHHALEQYFFRANVGISYIPITPYYDNQPPTKTYEYLLSGLICIATSTKENGKIVNEQNGLLIKDNSMDFFRGLENVYVNRLNFKTETIIASVRDCTWEKIVNNKLKQILDSII